MFVEKFWEGWIIAVHKIRECRRRMRNETRRKNVMTEISNVYSTYNTLVIGGYQKMWNTAQQLLHSTFYRFYGYTTHQHAHWATKTVTCRVHSVSSSPIRLLVSTSHKTPWNNSSALWYSAEFIIIIEFSLVHSQSPLLHHFSVFKMWSLG